MLLQQIIIDDHFIANLPTVEWKCLAGLTIGILPN